MYARYQVLLSARKLLSRSVDTRILAVACSARSNRMASSASAAAVTSAMPKVAVIGAGLSGAACAYQLASLGTIAVTCFDMGTKPGTACTLYQPSTRLASRPPQSTHPRELIPRHYKWPDRIPCMLPYSPRGSSINTQGRSQRGRV